MILILRVNRPLVLMPSVKERFPRGRRRFPQEAIVQLRWCDTCCILHDTSCITPMQSSVLMSQSRPGVGGTTSRWQRPIINRARAAMTTPLRDKSGLVVGLGIAPASLVTVVRFGCRLRPGGSEVVGASSVESRPLCDRASTRPFRYR